MAPVVRRVAWRVTAAVFLLCAVFCLVRWGDASSPEPAVEASTSSGVPITSAGEARTSAKAAPTGDRAPARPVGISIPAIGVTSRLVGLGLNHDGSVEVPADAELAGWYRLGTRPGATGSAVILGHVDSDEGPAVFYLLRTLARGDLVDVATADGRTEGFRVQSVRTYPNGEFPAQRVYAARGSRILNLVTCGGAYDAALGGYQANVVVETRWSRTR